MDDHELLVFHQYRNRECAQDTQQLVMRDGGHWQDDGIAVHHRMATRGKMPQEEADSQAWKPKGRLSQSRGGIAM